MHILIIIALQAFGLAVQVSTEASKALQKPIWQEHLCRDATLYQHVEQAKTNAMQSSPLYHALLV